MINSIILPSKRGLLVLNNTFIYKIVTNMLITSLLTYEDSLKIKYKYEIVHTNNKKLLLPIPYRCKTSGSDQLFSITLNIRHFTHTGIWISISRHLITANSPIYSKSLIDDLYNIRTNCINKTM